MLTGMTLIRNGNKLKYPWKECVISMSNYCSNVLVNCDAGEDNTLDELMELKKEYPNIFIYEHKWDMSNTGDGSELAKQANNLLPYVANPWVVYLQADEFILEDVGKKIRQQLQTAPDIVTQIELYRTYFWGSLDIRAEDQEIWLGRIFRKGSHTVGGDGMYLNKRWGTVARYKGLIYHYSRMGSEEDVNTRWRNLDKLFHDPEVVNEFEHFSYSNAGNLIQYNGPHPTGVKEFYNG